MSDTEARKVTADHARSTGYFGSKGSRLRMVSTGPGLGRFSDRLVDDNTNTGSVFMAMHAL